MKGLIANIITYAIIDWKTKKNEVREFFKSDWAHELCAILNLSADDILAKLESGKIKIDASKWRNWV